MKTIEVNKRDYISPSQINSFIERRDQYVRNYVMGEKWKGNSSFGRGNAVEHAVDLIVEGMEIAQAAESACRYYKEYCEENGLSRSEAEKISTESIDKMVHVAGNYYKHELNATPEVERQKKIVLELDGCPKRIVGYCDYIFPDSLLKRGAVRDLKTSSKTPSKLSDGYKLQGTVYHLATGLPVFFDYIVGLKSGPKIKTIRLEEEDIVEFKKIIIAASGAMEKFWDIVPDEITEEYIDAFNALAFPNIYGMWNTDEKAAAIKQLTS